MQPEKEKDDPVESESKRGIRSKGETDIRVNLKKKKRKKEKNRISTRTGRASEESAERPREGRRAGGN